jgi:hypothetical protein
MFGHADRSCADQNAHCAAFSACFAHEEYHVQTVNLQVQDLFLLALFQLVFSITRSSCSEKNWHGQVRLFYHTFKETRAASAHAQWSWCSSRKSSTKQGLIINVRV